jgi:hypothetical protein
VFFDQANQAGMLERLIDIRVTLQPFRKDRIGLDLGAGDFDRDCLIRVQIGAAKCSGKAAFGDHTIDLVMIETIAWTNRSILIF